MLRLVILTNRNVVFAQVDITASRDVLIVRQGHIVGLLSHDVRVRSLQVCLDATGRLSRHLQTTLQDRLGEVVYGHRGQDQTELWVHIVILHNLGHEDLKLWHPGLEQVAVLEEDPVTIDLALRHVACRGVLLA